MISSVSNTTPNSRLIVEASRLNDIHQLIRDAFEQSQSHNRHLGWFALARALNLSTQQLHRIGTLNIPQSESSDQITRNSWETSKLIDTYLEQYWKNPNALPLPPIHSDAQPNLNQEDQSRLHICDTWRKEVLSHLEFTLENIRQALTHPEDVAAHTLLENAQISLQRAADCQARIQPLYDRLSTQQKVSEKFKQQMEFMNGQVNFMKTLTSLSTFPDVLTKWRTPFNQPETAFIRSSDIWPQLNALREKQQYNRPMSAQESNELKRLEVQFAILFRQEMAKTIHNFLK